MFIVSIVGYIVNFGEVPRGFGSGSSDDDTANLERTVSRQDKRIKELNSICQKLQTEVASLRKAMEQLTLQFGVAENLAPLNMPAIQPKVFANICSGI